MCSSLALEYDRTAHDIVVDFHSYGKGYEALMTPHGGFRHPITEESFVYEDFGHGIVRAPVHTLINGMNVFSFAISKPPKSIETFMADYNIDRDHDIDYFLIHQANKMIVDRIVKKLKLPLGKVPYNLEEFGNLGSFYSLVNGDTFAGTIDKRRENFTYVFFRIRIDLGNRVDEVPTDDCTRVGFGIVI